RKLRRGAHDPRLGPADPDRERSLQRLWRAERAIDAVVLPVVGGAVFFPHPRTDLERLSHLSHTSGRVGEVVAIRAIFDLLPARADPEVEPAAAHDVDAGRDLGEERWVAVGLRGHHRSDPDTSGLDRERGEEGPRLEAIGLRRIRTEEEVVAQPETREPGGLAVVGDREHILELESELWLDLDPKIHCFVPLIRPPPR